MIPDGSLLSCYTASIAEALYRRGQDWRAVIGLSSVLAVRPDGPGRFAFVHHVGSLRPLAAPGTRRSGTADPAALAAGLRAALEPAGHVIAVADAGRLPWAPAQRGRQVPHWLVLGPPAGGRWPVTDRFRAPDGDAEHQPWQGEVAESELRGLLELPALRIEQKLREQYAFGDSEPPLDLPYQWFTTALPLPGTPPSADPDRVDGWRYGAAAVTELAGHFAAAGAAPGAYSQADDLWVASRHRQLRAAAMAAALPPGDPRVAAAGELARAWQRVPMVTRYAAEAARRGRSKAATLAAVLHTVAEAEAADAVAADPVAADPVAADVGAQTVAEIVAGPPAVLARAGEDLREGR